MISLELVSVSNGGLNVRDNIYQREDVRRRMKHREGLIQFHGSQMGLAKTF